MPTIFQRYRLGIFHASFWCVYLSFFLYQISSAQRTNEIDWTRVLTIVSIQVLFALAISYLNYFYLMPRFLMKKKIWLFVIFFLFAFGLIMFGRMGLERYLIDNFSGEERYLYRTRFIVQVVTSNLFIVIFVSLLRFAADWLQLETQRKEIEKEKLTAELNFLKAQVNPHFLFNTLNNLYYLAYSKSENTTEVIAKLSQMMRYMIYDSNYPKVMLDKEIEYMQNYISLERLRLNNQIPIKFDIEGDTGKIMITPLILITFLENAFKHGVSNSFEGAWINISLKVTGHEFDYAVENSKIPNAKPEAGEKSGIGLQNVSRRLELSYPGKYLLTTEDLPNLYRVKLKITLS